MTKHYYLNGALVPAAAAHIGVQDIGLLRGFGIFDYFSIRGGKPLFLDFHLDRFYQSAQGMGMKIPLDKAVLVDTIFQLIKTNQTFDAAFRLVLTGGYSPNSFSPTTPNFIIMEQAFPYPDPSQYEQGVHLLLHQYTREIPEIKTTNYIVPILQAKRLQETGAYDLLYHDGVEVSESSRSNFFAILPDKTIITPVKNILKGITRHHVLEVSKYTNYILKEAPLTLDVLNTAEEAFLTSTTKGILPVIKIDNQKVGSGRVGPVTQELMAYWEDYVDQYLEEIPTSA